jgi:hypothetical protein
LTAWTVGKLIDVLNPNCDGMVAAAANTIEGIDLRESMTQGQSYQKIDTNAGSDSAAGCGANSSYLTSWSVTEVE